MSPLSVTNVVNSLLTQALKWQDYVLVPVGAVVVIRASAAVLARS
jgi:hypothetical protein